MHHFQELKRPNTIYPESGLSYVRLVNTKGLTVTIGVAAYIKERNKNIKRSSDGYNIIRVLDLKITHNGQKFAYCYRYLRPDQISGSIRDYYRKEVVMKMPSKVDAFKIPLEAITGICSVIDIESYVNGRPKDFLEKDVYVCEYQMANYSSEWTVIRNEGHCSYMFPNQGSDCFDMFETKFHPVRNYQVSHKTTQ